MKVAIHQPNYLPWLGYFKKMKMADKFIFFGNAQYSKGSYQNRTKIKTGNGVFWLTIPVKVKGKLGQPINEVEMVDKRWKRKHIRTLEMEYRKAKYIKDFLPIIENIIISCDKIRIQDLNIKLIKEISKLLDIKTEIIENIDLQGKSTELLVSMVKEVGGTEYIFGKGSRNYQDNELFLKNGIKLKESFYEFPSYNQVGNSGFIPGLSIIDALFNVGIEGCKNLI